MKYSAFGQSTPIHGLKVLSIEANILKVTQREILAIASSRLVRKRMKIAGAVSWPKAECRSSASLRQTDQLNFLNLFTEKSTAQRAEFLD